MLELEKEIFKTKRLKRAIFGFLPTLIICHWISPFISAFAIKKKISPNALTVLMIPFSIVAAVLFSLPFWYVKIAGALLIHIWYTLDISDGEVARFTKNFSKYGTELDFLAHQICHIVLIVAFAINLYQLNLYKTTYILLVMSGLIFAEYSFRNICSIEVLFARKDNQPATSSNEGGSKKSNRFLLIIKKTIGLVFGTFHCADNYFLIGSIIVFVDIFFKTHCLFILSIIIIIVTLLNCFFITIRLLHKAVKN